MIALLVGILPGYLIFVQEFHFFFNCFFLTALTLPGHHRSEPSSSDLIKIGRLLQCNGFSRSTPGSCRRDSQ